jgi:thymidylate kinase
MLSVALIGPDGAGKTTISRRLEQALPLPVKCVYMGINLASSNVLLPTSWLIVEIRRAFGRTEHRGVPTLNQCLEQGTLSPGNAVKRGAAWLRSYLRLANLLAEECFRHSLVWYYQRRGKIVLLDRWFFADYYTTNDTDHARQPLSRRIHSYMLERIYPTPDLVIYLEAPAEMLFARKGEGTLETLERQRQNYQQLRGVVKHFAVVDASQPEHVVASDVTALIYDYYNTKVFDSGDERSSGEGTSHENFDRQFSLSESD